MRRSLLLAGSALVPAVLAAFDATALAAADPAPTPAPIDVGVAAAVTPASHGISSGRGDRLLVIGYDLEHKERIVTSAVGRTQVLFIDESSMTVGPNANVVLDEFVFDPATGVGKVAATVTRGALRFVGGRISKTRPVEFRTPVAVIGVRGGVGSITVNPDTGATTATLHFGAMTITNQSGVTREITAPGFKVDVTAIDQAPTAPVRATATEVGQALNAFAGTAESDGGATERPTEQRLAADARATRVAERGSAVDPATVRSAPPGTRDTRTAEARRGEGADRNGDGQEEAALPPPPPPGEVGGVPGSEPATVSDGVSDAGGPPAPSESATTTTPPPPPPETTTEQSTTTDTTSAETVLALAGGVLSARDGATLADGSVISDPASVGVLDGGLDGTAETFTEARSSDGRISMTLSTGETISVVDRVGSSTLSAGDATSDTGGDISGSMFLSAARDFLFVRGMGASETSEGLLFGGTATANGGKVTSTEARLDGYTLESAIETRVAIPFAPSRVAELFASYRATPFYVMRQDDGVIGEEANDRRTGTLQVSMGVVGTGSGQSSFIMATTGRIAPGDGSSANIIDQEMMGSVLSSATAGVTTIDSRISTVTDPSGNGFFGSDLDYLVLDQNSVTNGVREADAGSITDIGSTASAERYGFTHVAEKSTTSTAFGDRSDKSLKGFAAAFMEFQQPGEGNLNRYTVAARDGDPDSVTIELRPGSGRMAATFNLTAGPLVGPDPGFSAVTLQFGGLTHSAGQSAVIDDRRFAAMNSTELASSFGGNAGRTDGGSLSGDRSILVTQELAPENNFLPSGVSFCACEFLNWGYWATDFDFGDSTDSSLNQRHDHAHLGTWVAGDVPDTAEIPTSGTASFSGHAIGSVESSGARYLAAGSMTATYDFGARSGNVAISNFDNRSFSVDVRSPVTGSRAVFTGSDITADVQTAVDGAFVRDGTDATGGIMGQFRHHESTGYTATGIFAGQK